MATASKPNYTEAEYLARERRAEYKSEFFRGEILPMSRATEEHDLIASNIAARLCEQRKLGNYKVYSSGMRLRTPSGLCTYADVTVACAEFLFADDHCDTLLTPRVIVEVLSESTTAYDLGRKFQHYRSFESLAHYVVITSNRVHVELYTCRPGRQWMLSDVDGLQTTFDLPAIDRCLKLSDVYENVALKQQPVRCGIDGAAETI